MIKTKKENVINARQYLGDRSPFVTKKIKNLKFNPKKKRQSGLNNIASSFIKNKNTKKRIHIGMLDVENEKNLLSTGLRSGEIKPKDIPPQIRSIIFSKSQGVKNNLLLNGINIFGNNTDEMGYQLFSNIQKVFYLQGFNRGKDGLFNLKSPIIKEMTSANYDSIAGNNKLCMMRRYEDKKFIPSVEGDFDALGSVFLLEDTGQAIETVKKKGATSFDFKHGHKYEVDSFGNGWALEVSHPKNKNIKHRHRIIKWKVQPAKSNCYPRCNERYNVRGVPMHSHEVGIRVKGNKIKANVVAKNLLNSFNNNQIGESIRPPIEQSPSPTQRRPSTSTGTPRRRRKMSNRRGGTGNGY